MEVIPDELKSKVENEVLPAMLKEGRWEGEIQYRNLMTGALIDVHAMTFTIRNSDGEPLYLANVSLDITERKRAEMELLREKQFTEKLLESLPGIFFLYDSTCHLKRWNKAHETAMGFTADELRDWYIPNWHKTPEDAAVGMALVKSVLETGVGGAFETTLINKEGRFVPYLISITRLMTPEGPVMMGVGIDITERKQAEEALRESEERFKLSMEATNDGLWDWNIKTDGGYFSPAYYLMLGYEVGAFPCEGNVWRDLIHPDDREHTLLANMDCIEGRRELFEVEYRMKAENGEWRWILGRGKCIARDEQGHALRMVGTHVDITERKRRRRRCGLLKKSTARSLKTPMTPSSLLKTVSSSSPIPSWQSFPATARKSSPGNPFLEFVHPDDRELRCHRHIKNECREKRFPDTYSFRAVNKSGNTLWVELSSVFLSWEGRPASLNFLRDITVEKKLESQLVHAQKMEAVGTLAGGIAHDFNNLLQAVQGYAELLLLPKGEGEPGYRELQEISRAAKRGGELTRQLLTFSRKVESKLQPVDLNRIVEDVRLLLERTIPKMIKIELHLTGNLHHVNADASQVEQILMNLAVNARDAMPDGGTLRIETKNVVLDEDARRSQPELTPGKYVLLAVADTGQGMDKSTLENIFDPFFTTKEVGKGTGLGLAMVYGIVKNHHGHITCVSKPGEGTAFEIYLPAVEHTERATTIVTGTEVLRGGHETVLLVDDDDSLRDLGVQILEAYGYTVMSAPDGESALQVYQECRDRIDLVVLDLIMPGMGGALCLQKLLEINPAAKVVIASGYSVNGETEKATESGAKAFIQKPYDVQQMLQVVREVLDE